MTNADKLFQISDGTIRMILLDNSPDDEVKQATNTICDDVCHALKLWDGVVSGINKVDPDTNWCDKTQEIIDKATALYRQIGFSVMP